MTRLSWPPRQTPLRKSRRRTAKPAGRRLLLEQFEERLLLAVSPISVADTSLFGRTGEGHTRLTKQASSMSADGQLVVFQSGAADLVANDLNRASNNPSSLSDVFLFNRVTGETSLISINRAGTASGNGASMNPQISADGRYILFESSASDLTEIPGGAINVYRRDLQTGTTILVSASLSGNSGGNSTSQNPTMSADGRYVAFESYANNLVAEDNNERRDVFVRDLLTSTTILVSSNLDKTDGGNGESFDPRMSPNGRFVAFGSLASNLVSNDGTNIEDVFVHDLQTGVTELISIDSAGANQSTAHNALSPGKAISSDGRYVLFETRAANLFPVSEGPNVFLRDRIAGTTTPVSVRLDGSPAVGGAGATMTPDGRFVAFVSTATTLVSGISDTNGAVDVFVRDMQAGTTRLVSLNAAGTGTGNRASGTAQYPFDFSVGPPVISPDGRYIAFASEASNLVAGFADGNDALATDFGSRRRDVFVRDMLSGTNALVSTNRGGAASGDNGSYTPAISADARVVAFESHAGNLVNGQDNLGYVDVFVRDLVGGQTQLASQRTPVFPAWRLNSSGGEMDSATPDGRFVSFRSGGVIYVHDRETKQVTSESRLPDGAVVTVPNFQSRLSASGRFLAFVSHQNLATAGPANTTNQNQVWIRDRDTGETRLASLNAAGAASAGGLWEFAFSQDGRYLAFSSEGGDLVSGFVDGNGNGFGARDIFVRHLDTGVTRLVSHLPGSSVAGGNALSYAPAFSADGSTLVFQSRASNLQASQIDANADDDIFAYDMASEAVTLVSANPANTAAGNRRSESPAVSASGRYIAFQSAASDLSAQDNPVGTFRDVFVRDLVTSTTVLVSTNAAGLLSGGGHSFEPSISADGRLVVFSSDANDLVADDSGQRDVFVRDLQTGVTTRASQSLAGGQANGLSHSPLLSANGRFLSFVSTATDLVAHFVDGNGPDAADLFVRDLSVNVTDLVTVNHSGTASSNALGGLAIGGRQFTTDGQTLFFTGEASNLVNGDRNWGRDVFAYQFGAAGQIRGSVFHDANHSGGQDGGEANMPFWTVYLDGNGNGRWDADERNVQTDASGNFAFTGLTPGTYPVGLVLADGYSRFAPLAPGTHEATVMTPTSVVSGFTFAVAPAQIDLQVASIMAPESTTMGREITVSWLVRNLGSDTASGDWQDAVYFSQDETLGADDVLLGVVPYVGGLPPGGIYSASLAAPVPATLAEGYRLIVQTDRRRQVAADSNRVNNVFAGDLASMILPQLTIGTPHNDQFSGANQQHYYQFTVPPSESAVVKLDSAAATGATELYVRRGQLPTPWEYDITSRTSHADQAVYLPATQAGTYYVLVGSRSGAAASAGYALTASLPGFSLDQVSSSSGGNRGRVTLQLVGTGFTSHTTATLISGEVQIEAAAVDYRTPTLSYATFDLQGQTPGQYDLKLTAGELSVTKSGAFQIVEQGVAALDFQLLVPASVRVPTRSPAGDGYDPRPRVIVTYKNNSLVDVPVPLVNLVTDLGRLSIEGHPATEILGGLQFFASASDGPAGYLRPGGEGRVEARFETSANAPAVITVRLTNAAENAALGEGISMMRLVAEAAGEAPSAFDNRTPNDDGIMHGVGSFDPNEIRGPGGYGSQHFVRVNEPLPYLISFENDPQLASAPAQEVFVSQQLDADLDWSTLELLDFGFGSLAASTPSGLQSYATRVNYQNQDGTSLWVDFSAHFDQTTGWLRWSFRSVDPQTGFLPESVTGGFLPVNDATKRGEGFVSYAVRPRSDRTTGTRIDAQAEIVFDTNATIATPAIFNTLDAQRPASSMTPLLPRENKSFEVQWNGVDESGGSGIRHYDVFVSDNGGPYTPWLTATDATSARFLNGLPGHSYTFLVMATDNTGFMEATTSLPQASTSISIHPWQNARSVLDVNDDTRILADDVLAIINQINAFGIRQLPSERPEGEPFLDPTGDEFITGRDALDIINYINAGLNAEGESGGSREAVRAERQDQPGDVAGLLSGELLSLLVDDVTSRTKRRQ